MGWFGWTRAAPVFALAALALLAPNRSAADAYPFATADPYPLPNPAFRIATREQLVPRVLHPARPAREIEAQWGVLAKMAGTHWALGDDEVISVEWGEPGYSMVVNMLGLFGDSSVTIVRQDSDGLLETHASSDWFPGDTVAHTVVKPDTFGLRLDTFNISDCTVKGKAMTCSDPFDRGPLYGSMPVWRQVDAARAQAILARLPNSRVRFPPLTRARTNLDMGALYFSAGTWISVVGNEAHKLSIRVAPYQLTMSGFGEDETVEFYDDFAISRNQPVIGTLATARSFQWVGENGSEVFAEKKLNMRGHYYSTICSPDSCTTYLPGLDGTTLLALRETLQGKGKAAHWVSAPHIIYYRIDRPIGPEWGALNYLQQVGLMMKPSSGQAVDAHYWLFDYDPHGEVLVGRDVDSRGRPSGAHIDIARTKTPATFSFQKFEPGAARPSMTGTLLNHNEASFDWYNDAAAPGAPPRPIMRVALYGGSGKAYRFVDTPPGGMLRTGDVFPNVALVDRAQIAGTAIALRADDRRRSDRAILADNEIVRAENRRIEAANRAAEASRPSAWDALLTGLYQGLGGGRAVTSSAWTANGGGPSYANNGGNNANQVIGPYGVTVGDAQHYIATHPSEFPASAPSADGDATSSGSDGGTTVATPAAEAPTHSYGSPYVPTPSRPRSVSVAAPPVTRPVYQTYRTSYAARHYFGEPNTAFEDKWMPVNSYEGIRVSALYRHELQDQIISQLRIENTNSYAVIVGITPQYQCQLRLPKEATAMTFTLKPGEIANGQNAGLYDYPCPGTLAPAAIGYAALSVKRVD